MDPLRSDIDTSASFSLSSRVRFRAVDDEGVLVHLDTGRVVVVNTLGLHLVKALETNNEYHELIKSIVTEFEVSSDQAEVDLKNFMAELNAEQLLDVVPKTEGVQN